MADLVLSNVGWRDAREEAIRRGELVESVYDSIEQEEGQYQYLPMFGKSKLFSQVGLSPGYKITRYLYCTVKGVKFFPTGINWIGYIAHLDDLSSGKRSVAVVFRGTMSSGEWWKDINSGLIPFPYLPTPSSGRVHSGFLSLYTSSSANTLGFETSLREQIIKELESLVHGPTRVEISIMGHSLGGALATLAACDIGHHFAAHGKVHAFIFGSPKVGDGGFKAEIDKVANVFRFENIGDLVPSLPPSIPVMSPYVAVGTLYKVDWARYSDKLKNFRVYEVRRKHDLELYMHGIALQPNMYSEEEAFAEMGISTSLTKEELKRELGEGDPQAMDELNSLDDLFMFIVYRDEESLHKYLLDCVYVARRWTQGSHSPEEEAVDRDYVLVNKWQDSLKDSFNVPPKWWVHLNKDVRQDKGTSKWLPRSKRPEDQPVSTNPEFN